MVEINELKEQIKNVAVARQQLQEVVNAKRQAMEKWEEENAEILGCIIAFSRVKEEQEAALRTMVIEVYCATGNKKPAEGVGIREVTRLGYDPKEALKWAMSHQIALSLDKKSFEGLAKTTPLDFVTVTTEPQATIATELPIEAVS